LSGPLIIWLSDDLTESWTWYKSETKAGYARTPAQKQALAEGSGQGAHVIISGQAVRIFAHELPDMRASERRAAAGFAIEDKIATAPEDQHIIVDDKDGYMAVISRTKMQEIVQVLKVAGLSSTHIYVDFDVVPVTENMLALGDRLIKPGKAGYTLDKNWTEKAGLGAGDIGPEFEIHSVLAALNFDKAINLAQGEFTARKSTPLSLAGLKRAAALLAVLGLSWAGWQGTQIHSLKTQTANIQSETRQIYKSVTGKEAANPARAVARDVKTRPKNSGEFLNLSAIFFAQLQNFDGVEIQSLRYDTASHAINLRLIYPDFEIASKLEQSLKSTGVEFTSGGVREQNGAMIGQAAIRLKRS